MFIVLAIAVLIGGAILLLSGGALPGGGPSDTGGGVVSQPPSGISGNLTPVEIETYAINAGFTGTDLLTAVAIAQAESSGNPNNYNPEPTAPGGTPTGQGSYGLWQIYLKKHPEFATWNLYDPQQNAHAAYLIYQAAGNSFVPWTTYNDGVYETYLAQLEGA